MGVGDGRCDASATLMTVYRLLEVSKAKIRNIKCGVCVYRSIDSYNFPSALIYRLGTVVINYANFEPQDRKLICGVIGSLQ